MYTCNRCCSPPLLLNSCCCFCHITGTGHKKEIWDRVPKILSYSKSFQIYLLHLYKCNKGVFVYSLVDCSPCSLEKAKSGSCIAKRFGVNSFLRSNKKNQTLITRYITFLPRFSNNSVDAEFHLLFKSWLLLSHSWLLVVFFFTPGLLLLICMLFF